MHGSKAYTRAVKLWKGPLELKALRKARKEANPPVIVPPEESGKPTTYIHNIEQGVTLPPHPEQIFAVIKIKGTQYKVTKDDRLVIETLGDEFEAGQQIVLDEVLMIGTKDYTSVGRPQVLGARVYATLEEQSRSEKVIVFKKRRRQGYQKSQGHRQLLNVLKINKIEHVLDETDLQTGLNFAEFKPRNLNQHVRMV
jgi:large subunit ribosomal protein L21